MIDWHERARADRAKIEQLERELARAELPRPSYQERVGEWLIFCFGPDIAADKTERNHRFLEEALELVQACGISREECLQLVDYAFSRPAGSPEQEVGGVMTTLASLCRAHGMDMADAGETELRRVWGKIETIRAKQAAKPRNSPLPQEETPCKPT